MQTKEESLLGRRDALKAVAMLAAAPLAGQTGGTSQSTPARAIAVENRREQNFDDGWRFLRGDAPGAELPAFDDTGWRALDLPHDFSVEDLPPRTADANGEGTLWGTAVLPTRVGPFDTERCAGGRDTGWFVGGTGWYRKRFSAAGVPDGAHLEIVFDGVYMNSDVWLNGALLGNHSYGYTAFAYDLTPHLRRSGENVLAVRVRNEGRNIRWYSGSGIYRHVRLNTTGSVRVPRWGLFVTTPEVSKENASVKVAVRIENRAQSPQDVTVRIRLLDPKGATAATREVPQQSLSAAAGADVEQVFTLTAPQLWSMNAPQLYRAEVELFVGGKATDIAATTFGIRKVEVDAERGLRINGQMVKLKTRRKDHHPAWRRVWVQRARARGAGRHGVEWRRGVRQCRSAPRYTPRGQKMRRSLRLSDLVERSSRAARGAIYSGYRSRRPVNRWGFDGIEASYLP